MTNSKPNITRRRRRGEESGPLFPITRRMDDVFEDFRRDMEDMFPITRRMDDVFEDFRRDMEDTFRSWPYSVMSRQFPALTGIGRETRLPVCDICDTGDKYEIQLEIPGIDKDKIDVKATKNSVEISAEQSEKEEEKKKNYIYNERSYRSFHRRIPMPEEIDPSKIDAKMNNGILQIQLPKKVPTKLEEETTRVEIK